jgi:hypothetical protein
MSWAYRKDGSPEMRKKFCWYALYLHIVPQLEILLFYILVMGVRLMSHWTATAFTGLFFVPGWGWMGEWTIILNFSKMWSPQWNDIDRGKPKDSEKNLSQCHFFHHKSHWSDPGANPGRSGEMLATNRLSYGTAFLFCNQQLFHLSFPCSDKIVCVDLYNISRIQSVSVGKPIMITFLSDVTNGKFLTTWIISHVPMYHF